MNTASSSSTTTPQHHQQDQDQEQELPRLEWNFRTVTSMQSSALPGASDAIGSIDFDPTGRLLATGGIARKIRIYSFDSFTSSSSTQESVCVSDLCICVPAKLSSVRWRPDGTGNIIGCGDYDGVVTEYDIEKSCGVAVSERDEHAGRRVWAVDYAPAGAHMAASGSDDRTAHLWDPRSHGAGWAIARAGGAVLSVEFDPSGGPHLAVGSSDRKAHVYDLRAVGNGPVQTFDGHVRAVTYVRFAREEEEGGSRTVVTSAADGTHRQWEWGEGWAREVRKYSGHVSARSFVGMSVWRSGGLVASGSESNEVFVYDLRWSQPIWVQAFGSGARGSVGGEGGGFVSAVTWRQGLGDGNAVLVAGGSDGGLKVFFGERKETVGV